MTPEEILLLTFPWTTPPVVQPPEAVTSDDDEHGGGPRSETPVVPIRVPDGETKRVKW